MINLDLAAAFLLLVGVLGLTDVRLGFGTMFVGGLVLALIGPMT